MVALAAGEVASGALAAGEAASGALATVEFGVGVLAAGVLETGNIATVVLGEGKLGAGKLEKEALTIGVLKAPLTDACTAATMFVITTGGGAVTVRAEAFPSACVNT